MDNEEENFFLLARDNLIPARTVIVAAASVLTIRSLMEHTEALQPD